MTIITGSLDAQAILRIVDMQGREVHRGRAQGRMDVDVSRWPSGNYVISVMDDTWVRHERQVVQR